MPKAKAQGGLDLVDLQTNMDEINKDLLRKNQDKGADCSNSESRE